MREFLKLVFMLVAQTVFLLAITYAVRAETLDVWTPEQFEAVLPTGTISTVQPLADGGFVFLFSRPLRYATNPRPSAVIRQHWVLQQREDGSVIVWGYCWDQAV